MIIDNYSSHDIAAYAGYISDENELMECTSGGIATALARKVIRAGGYVAGVAYSSDFYKAQYEIAHHEDQLDRFKGSKYVEVDKGSVYRDVKALLEDGNMVLFFGLPCVVAAMRKFLDKDYDNFLAVELICHGPASSKVHRQYIEHLEKEHNSKVVDFSVRKKHQQWVPGYLYAEFENGDRFQEDFYKTEYGYAFSVTGNSGCYDCHFRGNNRTGDMMLGDFWGATENDVFWNHKGVSSILVHTEKADKFLKSIVEIRLFDTTFDRIVEKNQNIINPRKPHPNKEKFDKLFAQHDLFYAAKYSKSLKSHLASYLKPFLPTSLMKYAKEKYHAMKHR